MSMDDVTAVFGWMTVFNLGVYLLAAAFVILARDRAARLQARMLGVPAEAWPALYVDFLGRYKIAILVFNLAPYLALRVVA